MSENNPTQKVSEKPDLDLITDGVSPWIMMTQPVKHNSTTRTRGNFCEEMVTNNKDIYRSFDGGAFVRDEKGSPEYCTIAVNPRSGVWYTKRIPTYDLDKYENVDDFASQCPPEFGVNDKIITDCGCTSCTRRFLKTREDFK